MVRGLPVEYHLDGGSNYGSWKPRVLFSLDEYGLKDFASKDVPIPEEEDR